MDRALEILEADAAGRDEPQPGNRAAPVQAKRARAPTTSGRWTCCKRFKAQHPDVPTKSGIMVGLGETDEEILQVMRDMRAHDVDMLTIGQYLQPTPHHQPVLRYWTPEEFEALREAGEAMGFTHVASGALVRSSYHADQQAHAAGVTESA